MDPYESERRQDMMRAVHGAKSYFGAAVLTFILYYIGFYVFGLITNILYLGQSRESMNITGRSPSGRGCLIFLLWTHLLIPLLIIVLLATVGLGGILEWIQF